MLIYLIYLFCFLFYLFFIQFTFLSLGYVAAMKNDLLLAIGPK